jgi:hypothetical protein
MSFGRTCSEYQWSASSHETGEGFLPSKEPNFFPANGNQEDQPKDFDPKTLLRFASRVKLGSPAYREKCF